MHCLEELTQELTRITPKTSRKKDTATVSSSVMVQEILINNNNKRLFNYIILLNRTRCAKNTSFGSIMICKSIDRLPWSLLMQLQPYLLQGSVPVVGVVEFVGIYKHNVALTFTFSPVTYLVIGGTWWTTGLTERFYRGRSSAWRSRSGVASLVQSLTFSDQFFLCLPLLLLPSSMPCKALVAHHMAVQRQPTSL
jgi:hypothetical protein